MFNTTPHLRHEETEIQRGVTPALRVSLQKCIDVLSLASEEAQKLDSVSSSMEAEGLGQGDSLLVAGINGAHTLISTS